MSSKISARMARILLSNSRVLEWVFWVESELGDFWAWSGGHTIEWNGQTLTGVGPILDFKNLEDVSSIEHTVGEYTLSGLDPAINEDGGGLSKLVRTNVFDKKYKHWMVAIENGAIVPDPIEVSVGKQDQISTSIEEDGSTTLKLITFESLPFINKASAKTITHEGQIAKHPTDVGFAFLTETSQQRGAVEWQQQ